MRSEYVFCCARMLKRKRFIFVFTLLKILQHCPTIRNKVTVDLVTEQIFTASIICFCLHNPQMEYAHIFPMQKQHILKRVNCFNLDGFWLMKLIRSIRFSVETKLFVSYRFTFYWLMAESVIEIQRINLFSTEAVPI